MGLLLRQVNCLPMNHRLTNDPFPMQQGKLLKGSIHVQSSFATAWKRYRKAQSPLILSARKSNGKTLFAHQFSLQHSFNHF